MLVGHLAAGFITKGIEPRISLGTCVMAALFADFLLFPLLLAGIERVETVPGVEMNRVVGSNITISHSLAMLVIWSALFAALYFWRTRNARGAWLLAAAVLSHWVLDVISHRPDRALAPGVSRVFGLGLWNSVTATLIVEGGIWVLGIIVYLRATRPKNLVGVFAFWIGVILLTIVWRANLTAGMDADPVRGGVGGLISFSLVTTWAYWVNRLRPPKRYRVIGAR